MRKLLQHGQVELTRLDQRSSLPDVDGLDPVAGNGVEDIDVRVAVHLVIKQFISTVKVTKAT